MKATIKLSMLVVSFYLHGLVYAGPGTSGAQFLKIISAPRPAALGGAYCAVSGGVNCISMNPAGLSLMDKKELSLTQNSMYQEISNQYLAFGVPVGNAGVLGFGVNMVNTGNMTKTDALGNELGAFGSNDMAVTLAYARTFSEKMSYGINIKSISQKIDDVSASGFAADLGVTMKISLKLDVGLAVQNMGTVIKFINEGDPLPMNIKLGSKLQINEPLMLAVDVNFPNDSPAKINLGFEYKVELNNFRLPVRLGYTTGETAGGLAGFSTGVGLVFNRFGVDLSWVPFGDLGDTYKVGLNFLL